jgi:hypothetical protein
MPFRRLLEALVIVLQDYRNLSALQFANSVNLLDSIDTMLGR